MIDNNKQACHCQNWRNNTHTGPNIHMSTKQELETDELDKICVVILCNYSKGTFQC